MSPSTLAEPNSQAFEKRLRSLVEAAVENEADSLDEFLAALRGADPSGAISLLETLSPQHPAAKRLVAEARRPRRSLPAPQPVGHPLDYSWLFTTATRQALLKRVEKLTQPGELVLHLGCPALHGACLIGLPDRDHLLIDRDHRRVDHANSIRPDSARPLDLHSADLGELGARVAIADPPWYPEPTDAFLNAAAIAVGTGGTVLLAFAGAMTRPSAPGEIEQVLLAAASDGLRLEAIERGTCRYETPPFELAALHAAGLPGIPSEWRRGDLYVFKRTGGCPPRRLYSAEAHWSSWGAFEIEGVPLRVRSSAPACGSSILSPLLAGGTLPTVSRRDPRREEAALWSASNRIFSSSDPAELERIVRDLERGQENELPKEVVEQLRALIRTERRDLGLR
jgi:hypothetical protein